MLKELKKALGNQARGQTKCQKVIGSKTSVKRFHDFWARNHDELMLVAVNALYKYIEENDPSQAELRAFKKGLATVALFIGNCHSEIENETKSELLKEV